MQLDVMHVAEATQHVGGERLVDETMFNVKIICLERSDEILIVVDVQCHD